ncbi:hypothetical protein [Xenorhabdus bovienii]|uniref:hypothetical protein n=1 Tax=Xenorhabdus bovienii TaxID=40576 RepID=UPI0023B2FB9C|nr:hypothetical protein [Xenorhabdus bovienii]MDE9432060.1 hypothetical protein [Xenorhabdus bovienii]MDE9506060.1 hypothetical protein [Xenorhabdus bovienii]
MRLSCIYFYEYQIYKYQAAPSGSLPPIAHEVYDQRSMQMSEARDNVSGHKIQTAKLLYQKHPAIALTQLSIEPNLFGEWTLSREWGNMSENMNFISIGGNTTSNNGGDHKF